MNVVCIIQARMGSSRLPGKVLLDLYGEPVLYRVLERVADAISVDKIVVATTTRNIDESIVQAVKKYGRGVVVSRGSEDDVLDRYYQAAKANGADIVIRVTSDCPLVDPEIIDQVVQPLLDDPDLDYCSNVLGQLTFPRGLDVQAVRMSVMEKIWNIAKELEDREHVTLYIRKHPEQFKTRAVQCKPDLSFHRWTVDEPDDYRLVKEIYTRLYDMNPKFRMKDVLELFVQEPELIKINQQVQQKLSQY